MGNLDELGVPQWEPLPHWWLGGGGGHDSPMITNHFNGGSHVLKGLLDPPSELTLSD